MTEESNETVERLVCPMGHMAKPDSDIEEGDECPHHDYCPQDNKMKNREVSKHRLELKDNRSGGEVPMSRDMTNSELREEYKSYLGPNSDGINYVPDNLVMEMANREMDKTVKHYILSKDMTEFMTDVESRDVKSVGYMEQDSAQDLVIIETEDGEERKIGPRNYKNWRRREEELNGIDIPSVEELKAVKTE